MSNWLVVFGFWAFSALICLPVLLGGAAAVTASVFLLLLLGLSTYLYSARFAALIERIFSRRRTA